MDLFLYLNVKSVSSLIKRFSKVELFSEIWKQLIFIFIGVTKVFFLLILPMISDMYWNWFFILFLFLDLFPKLLFPSFKISQITSIIRLYISKSKVIDYVFFCLVLDPFVIVSIFLIFYLFLFSEFTTYYFFIAILFCVFHNILVIVSYFYSLFGYLIVGFFYSIYFLSIGVLFFANLKIIVVLSLILTLSLILFLQFFNSTLLS